MMIVCNKVVKWNTWKWNEKKTQTQQQNKVQFGRYNNRLIIMFCYWSKIFIQQFCIGHFEYGADTAVYTFLMDICNVWACATDSNVDSFLFVKR